MSVSILEFGATPNTDSLQNLYIQNAIDHCFLNGGGEVVVPKGEYLISGLRLRSNVTLRLLSGAKLVGSRKIEEYRVLLDDDPIEPLPERIMPDLRKPQSETDLRMYYCAMIHIYAANNVAIIGEKDAVIDGQNCYNPNGEEEFRGPHCINVLKSSNVTFRGYTAQHAGGDTHCIWACKNVLCEHLTLLGGNNGISLYKTKKITVRYCNVATGNDCFVGFNNHDVFIEDNELNTSCNCFRFAGTNVTIRHCNAYGPGKYAHRLTMPKQALVDGEIGTIDRFPECRYNLIGFFIYYGDKRMYVRKTSSNIILSDCNIVNSNRFFTFQYDKSDPWQQNKPLSDITFRNIQAEGLRIPILVYGSKKSPISLFFENCNFQYANDRRNNPLIKAANCSDIKLSNVSTNMYGSTTIATYGNFVNNISTKGDYTQSEFKIGVWALEDFETTFI